MDSRQEFIEFAVAQEVLRFGSFTTKAGRLSPYFFNAGLFNNGAALGRLAEFYAQAIIASGIVVDGLFGPAYKGIPLVAAVAVALARTGRNLPFSFNRKEAKEHGEGGSIVGAPLAGRVLIIDDVISAGTSIRESVALICAAGASPCGVVIALDRMERGSGEWSAVQEVEQNYGIPVLAVANLDDLLGFLREHPDFTQHEVAVAHYRQAYGLARDS
ncbi:orotate phosphoribosyltransferase [Candidatus Accumulibacter vicinus]|uniref:Orotate phosphoribosyltransferase n=1 Tax=Candidatus Accumulibacter vicinus TaxID=2954382 RepID=A0A084Y617_9PROT|nr:orotate phosphoribosyltransferase [Candidatus Accumulibacter vicinus]KFB70161.1 MAG: Orotate phosphoribosyltransferase [Candidatus Accumulibacter vicinus]